MVTGPRRKRDKPVSDSGVIKSDARDHHESSRFFRPDYVQGTQDRVP